MQAGEVVCNAILHQDLQRGLDYALKSISFTYDRMRFGRNTTEAYLKRLRNITLGKCAEAAIVRFLRAHGVRHSSFEGATPHTLPDRFDLKIAGTIVDIKSYTLPEKHARADRVINALALIPNDHPADQWQHRQRFGRYVFVFIAGLFSVTLQLDLNHLLDQEHILSREEINVSASNLRAFLTAAPTIQECEAKFHRVRPKTRCLQYPYGTRIENMGCLVRDLTAFSSVFQWGGV